MQIDSAIDKTSHSCIGVVDSLDKACILVPYSVLVSHRRWEAGLYRRVYSRGHGRDCGQRRGCGERAKAERSAL